MMTVRVENAHDDKARGATLSAARPLGRQELRMTMVDTHVHPVAEDHTRYPLSPGDGPPWYLDWHFTVEQILQQMDHAGVDQVVLVSSSAAYGTDNSYAADAAQYDPARCVGVCRIDGNAPTAPETLRSWIQDRGMRGVRLGAGGPAAFPVCERALELGIPVAIQLRRDRLGEVGEVARRFPALKVILDHLAHPLLESGPPYADAAPLFALADLPNVYFKFSTMNIHEAAAGKSTPRAFFETLLECCGPDHLMWGSNFPHTTGSRTEPYKDLIDLARETFGFLSESEREQVFAGTARSLFPALARPTGS
jgi:predicted TIM-barrel fold metal-dependent hydrolase